MSEKEKLFMRVLIIYLLYQLWPQWSQCVLGGFKIHLEEKT